MERGRKGGEKKKDPRPKRTLSMKSVRRRDKKQKGRVVRGLIQTRNRLKKKGGGAHRARK